MPRYFATMVKGDPRDYPTLSYTCFEPRPDGAGPRARRKTVPFVQGERREVSKALADQLRGFKQPVVRGPEMFKIEIVEDKAEPKPATSGKPKPTADDDEKLVRRVRVGDSQPDSPRVSAPAPVVDLALEAKPEVPTPRRARRAKS